MAAKRDDSGTETALENRQDPTNTNATCLTNCQNCNKEIGKYKIYWCRNATKFCKALCGNCNKMRLYSIRSSEKRRDNRGFLCLHCRLPKTTRTKIELVQHVESILNCVIGVRLRSLNCLVVKYLA